MIDQPTVEPSTTLELAPLPAEATMVDPVTPRPITPPVPTSRRFWTALLAVAVVMAAGGLWLVYNDDMSAQNALSARITENESLQGNNLILQSQLSATQGSLSSAQSDLAAAEAELKHPNLGIWNVRQTISGPSYYLDGGIPDTFTYHLRLKSTGPMNVSILEFEQFAAAIKCVENGVGPTNYCMHHSGAVSSWLGVRSVSTDFHLAEGCAGYMMIITAPGRVTVTPDVSVTYNPAPNATGTCRS